MKELELLVVVRDGSDGGPGSGRADLAKKVVDLAAQLLSLDAQ
jgi:hypothetical protein